MPSASGGRDAEASENYHYRQRDATPHRTCDEATHDDLAFLLLVDEHDDRLLRIAQHLMRVCSVRPAGARTHTYTTRTQHQSPRRWHLQELLLLSSVRRENALLLDALVLREKGVLWEPNVEHRTSGAHAGYSNATITRIPSAAETPHAHGDKRARHAPSLNRDRRL
jgi:hypothetical protein